MGLPSHLADFSIGEVGEYAIGTDVRDFKVELRCSQMSRHISFANFLRNKKFDVSKPINDNETIRVVARSQKKRNSYESLDVFFSLF